LKPTPGSRQKEKRKGRGTGAEHGKTSTKGHKENLARAGGKKKPGFEGGQMPITRRIPKRGFTPYRRVRPAIINLESLGRLNNENPVTPESLKEAGLIRNSSILVKVLGQGELKKPFRVQAHLFSRSAVDKIKQAGGETTVIQRSKRTNGKKDSSGS